MKREISGAVDPQQNFCPIVHSRQYRVRRRHLLPDELIWLRHHPFTDQQAKASRQRSQGFLVVRKDQLVRSRRHARQVNGNGQSRSVHNGFHPKVNRLRPSQPSTGLHPSGGCPSSRSSTSISLRPSSSFQPLKADTTFAPLRRGDLFMNDLVQHPTLKIVQSAR